MTTADETTDALSLEQLSENLSRLAEQLEQHQSETVSMFQQFHEHVETLAQQIESLQSGAGFDSEEPADAPPETPAAPEPEAELPQPIPTQPAAVEQRAVPAQSMAALPVATPVQPTAMVVDDSQLENIIFGDELAGNDQLRGDRGQLLQGLLTGDEDAMALAGQLLIFRAANSETMPQLLKGIGEAYYAWRPQTSRTDDPFRSALIAWLGRECEAVGVTHRIELARPGDRFDSKRHQSKDRGVEVSEVHGWMVVRDNGSAYTKAAVSVQ